MRLISVDLDGFRRFEKASVNLDAPVIAVVGPNEAGKSSLLEALDHLDRDEAFERGDMTRDLEIQDGRVIVRAAFLLDDDDRVSIAHLPGGLKVRWFFVGRKRDGTLALSTSPVLHRQLGLRRKAGSAVGRLLAQRWAQQTQSDGEEAQGADATAVEAMEAAASVLGSDAETLTGENVEQLVGLEGALAAPSLPASAKNLRVSIRELVAAERADHPQGDANKILWSQAPDFLMFGEDDRWLEGEYDLAAIAPDPPGALANLCALADLSLPTLLEKVQRGEYPQAETMIRDANQHLKAVFSTAWKQSNVAAYLGRDGGLLRIFVETADKRLSSIAERSDGLRSFLALVAYTASKKPSTRPILMIDEAERHLHYDGQADLVRVFTLQTAAAKVVYTTHSAGCLPQDLGTGIRIVEPDPVISRSTISNSFWTSGAGFLPLLLGMGASALAFTPARFVAIAEGASDAVLIPSLLREVIGHDELEYQVAPGLAEISPAMVADLDLEAARVAYVVDGDAGGQRHVAKLRKSRVPDDLIVILGGPSSGMVIEDVIDPEIYRAAVNDELGRSNSDVKIPASAIPTWRRPQAVEAWCSKKMIGAPSKVAVASRVVEQRQDKQLVMPSRRAVLRKLAVDLDKALRIKGTKQKY